MCHEVKVGTPYISRLSVFFFLKDYLMDEDHTRVTVTFDLKINVGYDDPYLTVQ